MEWKYDCGTPNDIKESSEFRTYADENKRKLTHTLMFKYLDYLIKSTLDLLQIL